ncbi:hypothetical protein M885DRAFT_495733 [Pelagophyceae sp. CCMP2097]|nr:hypothetical protein M885DRAFT_495733 [Pelagophyceae sp. CCMP2097]
MFAEEAPVETPQQQRQRAKDPRAEPRAVAKDEAYEVWLKGRDASLAAKRGKLEAALSSSGSAVPALNVSGLYRGRWLRNATGSPKDHGGDAVVQLDMLAADGLVGVSVLRAYVQLSGGGKRPYTDVFRKSFFRDGKESSKGAFRFSRLQTEAWCVGVYLHRTDTATLGANFGFDVKTIALRRDASAQDDSRDDARSESRLPPAPPRPPGVDDGFEDGHRDKDGIRDNSFEDDRRVTSAVLATLPLGGAKYAVIVADGELADGDDSLVQLKTTRKEVGFKSSDRVRVGPHKAVRVDWPAAQAAAATYAGLMTLVCLAQLALLFRQLAFSRTQAVARRGV